MKAAEDRIVSCVAEDESDGVTVSDISETNYPAVVPIFIDGPIPSKAFAKVGMQMDFIPAGTEGSKYNLA